VTTTLLPPSEALQNDFSASDSEWEGLPPAEETPDLPPVIDQKPDVLPSGLCQGCGEPIVREPGTRGRLPKFHPDCRPLKSAGSSTAQPSVRSNARNTRAAAEAEAVVAAIQKQIIQAAVMLSVVDRFDAYSVMVALPNVCTNLKGVLARNDKLRKEFMNLGSGGSIIGLILSIVMMFLPMAAHHGLLGKGNAAKLLVEMPFTLMKIQQRLKEGTEALTKMMAEQLQKAKEENLKQSAPQPAAETGAA
jgi:tetrahydromethanopterin S-methyltransferase subunit F